MSNEQLRRMYRESVARAGAAGINRQDAFEETTAEAMAEIMSGRMVLDMETAVRRQLKEIDEKDGHAADTLLRRAVRFGEVPLAFEDLEIVVTLGGGKRKTWGGVTAQDLQRMDELRAKAKSDAVRAYAEFNRDYRAALPILFEYETVEIAFEAGAFTAGSARAAA